MHYLHMLYQSSSTCRTFDVIVGEGKTLEDVQQQHKLFIKENPLYKNESFYYESEPKYAKNKK